MFLLELFLTSLSKDDYFLSFFFWLDLISTLSILLDIGWISNAIYGSGGTSSVQSTASLARAGRASKIATRAGRIIRIMRLIRLVKLYKHAQQALIEKEKKLLHEKAEKEKQEKGIETARRNSAMEQEMAQLQQGSKDQIPSKIISSSKEGEPMIPSNDDFQQHQANPEVLNSQSKEEEDKKEAEFPQESNVGRKLSDLTTKRVITLVLSIIISIPLLNQETYVEDTTSHEAGLRLIDLWAPKSLADYNAKNWSDYDMYNLTVTTYINEYRDTSPKLIYLKLAINANDNAIIYSVSDPNDLRTNEKQIFSFSVFPICNSGESRRLLRQSHEHSARRLALDRQNDFHLRGPHSGRLALH